MFFRKKPKAYKIGFEFTFLASTWTAKMFTELQKGDMPVEKQLILLRTACENVLNQIEDVEKRRN